MSLAFILFALCSDVSLLLIGLLLSAMTFGTSATLPNAFWAEFYGTENLGALKALAAAIMVLGSAIGPGVTGILIDAGVPLDTQYLWVAGYFLICSVLIYIGVSRSKSMLHVMPA